MSYGCTVFNRFAIGEDEEEEDPFEALAKLEIKKKEEKEKSTQKTKETKEAKNKVQSVKPAISCRDLPHNLEWITGCA